MSYGCRWARTSDIAIAGPTLADYATQVDKDSYKSDETMHHIQDAQCYFGTVI